MERRAEAADPMKVFICNRNLLTWPSAMARHLADRGHEPVFVDNNSGYPPLLDYYRTSGFQVIRHPYNLGPWDSFRALPRQNEPFVFTDPDLDLSTVPDDWPDVLLAGLLDGAQEYEGHPFKCGLSIEDSDLPRASVHHAVRAELEARGQPFDPWDAPIQVGGRRYWRKIVDTTFALYPPGYGPFTYYARRTDRPYCARHLPWYVVRTVDPSDPATQIPLDDEYRNYLRSAGSACSLLSWSAVRKEFLDESPSP